MIARRQRVAGSRHTATGSTVLHRCDDPRHPRGPSACPAGQVGRARRGGCAGRAATTAHNQQRASSNEVVNGPRHGDRSRVDGCALQPPLPSPFPHHAVIPSPRPSAPHLLRHVRKRRAREERARRAASSTALTRNTSSASNNEKSEKTATCSVHHKEGRNRAPHRSAARANETKSNTQEARRTK